MKLPSPKSDRFTVETGFNLAVQVPNEHAKRLLDCILIQTGLEYGLYDRVTFRTSPGVQTFRALPESRNAVTLDALEIPCVEVSFFLPNDETLLTTVLETIYRVHPYEEPVLHVTAALRTLHIPGMDEDNPNKFWNKANEDWVPVMHRKPRDF